MKSKKSTLYECQHCGWQSSKWLGKCPGCNAWESLIELTQNLKSSKPHSPQLTQAKAVPITQVQEERLDYFSSTQSELDIVLGGGIVRGGLYLIGGSPGVGKSTLLLKVAGDLANGVSENKENRIETFKEFEKASKENKIETNEKTFKEFAKEEVPPLNISQKTKNLLEREELESKIKPQSFNDSKMYEAGKKDSKILKTKENYLQSQNYNEDSKKDCKIESKIENSKTNPQHESIKSIHKIAEMRDLECKNNLDSKHYNQNFQQDSRLHPKPSTPKALQSLNLEPKLNNLESSPKNHKTVQNLGRKVLYVSGEESLSQIHNRAKRCRCLSDNLYLLSEIDILEIKEALLNGGFEVCIIDSIQTIYTPNLSAAPGSVSQVREITFELMRLAKSFNIAMFIIGHITKDGQIAGPRVLEHMVDCVLYFEGERNNELKILRGFKNRFGTTSEIGIFEMKSHGLVSANEATKKFFNAKKDMPGSAAVAIMEGSRCIVVEIQALTCENEFGMPKRLSNGFDSNRLNMILALLEKKLGIHLHRHDVFVNVAGGIKISETSADLALIASILSSYKNRPLKSSTAFIGEVSLIGDIREVGALEVRLKELANFGFKNAIVPNIPKSYKGQVKCVQALEVAQIIEWM